MKLHFRAMGCHLPYGTTPASWHKWSHPALSLAREQYMIYLPWRNGRLSWPRWPVTYQDGLLACRWSPTQVLTQRCTAGSRSRDLLITSPTP